eukprot:6896027-Prorocentrum_lima.AAC.1
MLPAARTIAKAKRQARGGKHCPSKQAWYAKMGWFQGTPVVREHAVEVWENYANHGVQDPPPEPTDTPDGVHHRNADRQS